MAGRRRFGRLSPPQMRYAVPSAFNRPRDVQSKAPNSRFASAFTLAKYCGARTVTSASRSWSRGGYVTEPRRDRSYAVGS